ncbi:hypothetical protein ACLBXM_13070 [Xanthobacteraceae bacterium A53D]
MASDVRQMFVRALASDVLPEDAAAILTQAMQAYAAPGRHYHAWPHVSAMLADLATLPPGTAAAFDDVVVAIVFHDAVYDPARQDNEAMSAELFQRAVPGLPASRRERIAALILATDHRRVAETPDERLICDIDLAILGAEPARYAAYVAMVRKEYAFVSDELWAAGRARVLSAFLARPILFRTAAFAHLEDAARENLSAELAGLEANASG